MKQLPPPVMDSSRLIVFAFNDEEVEFTDRISIFVGKAEALERLGEMPCIAICSSYPVPEDILLFFCDAQWEVQGTIPFRSVEEAKLKAERGYKGISAKWQESPYTEEETDEYLREKYEVDPATKWWEMICSFCGKDFFAEGQGLAGPRAAICRQCVEKFYAHFQEEDGA